MSWFSGVLVATAVLSGCGQSKKEVSKNDDHLTVYLWENRLMKNIAPYIHEQFPDQDIEFIIGNNDTDLYSYFKEHDELPDIITVRRFSGTDAQDLQPYLMDFASYDVVSKYYSYAVQYYKNEEDEIQWLPICGIPQTIIANKTLFDQYGIKIPENYEEYVQACQQFYDNGIKPYSMDLGEDWSNNEIIQAAAIGEFTSLDGIEWRNGAETAADEVNFDDALLPAGLLRESVHVKNRAQIVIVTKCPPDIKPIDFNIITKSLNLFPYQMLFFSAFRYGNLQPAFPEIAGKTERKLSTLQADEQVLLLTGIASPAPIMQELEKYTSHIDLLAFDDHHNFSQRDIQSIRERFKKLKG